MRNLTRTGLPAIVANRADEAPVDTEEIGALTEAAGYEVVGEVTQVRPEDPGTYFGDGKVEELSDLVAETGAQLVVIDDELTPGQTKQLEERFPDDTHLYDRYRLVLDIFDKQAQTRRAQLQVELVRYQYELPRIKDRSDPQDLNIALEKGTRVDDAHKRINELKRKLEELPSPAEQFRERRREEGFDLVTLAGYTNAGKSTLLHRLADDLDLADASPDHPDRDATAEIEDRLFKTLDTTTRRATLRGRPVLLTDTVGLIQDLPHWMVESFSETLSEVAVADVVILVADARNPVEQLRERLSVSLDTLEGQGVEGDRIVLAMNKVDLLDDDETETRVEVGSEFASTVVPISGTEGTGIDELVERVHERLPTEDAEIRIPNCDDAMEVVSWAYDHVTVRDVDYAGDTVRMEVSGRPERVRRVRTKADDVTDDG